MEEDETLDKEFDKIFHDEKVNLSTLNPSAGEVDEERKKYYRYKTAVIFRSIQWHSHGPGLPALTKLRQQRSNMRHLPRGKRPKPSLCKVWLLIIIESVLVFIKVSVSLYVGHMFFQSQFFKLMISLCSCPNIALNTPFIVCRPRIQACGVRGSTFLESWRG